MVTGIIFSIFNDWPIGVDTILKKMQLLKPANIRVELQKGVEEERKEGKKEGRKEGGRERERREGGKE